MGRIDGIQVLRGGLKVTGWTGGLKVLRGALEGMGWIEDPEAVRGVFEDMGRTEGKVTLTTTADRVDKESFRQSRIAED